MAHFERYNTSDATTGQAPLLGNASITPIVIESSIDGVLVGTLLADQSSATNGLVIAQSFDYNALTGTGHWDYAVSSSYTTPNVGILINQPLYAPFVRLSYTNGAVAQGLMRLFIRTYGSKTSIE